MTNEVVWAVITCAHLATFSSMNLIIFIQKPIGVSTVVLSLLSAFIESCHQFCILHHMEDLHEAGA